MAVLTLDYRCCDRKRPLYIKHIEVERIAATARQQLVADNIDAVSFDALRQISGLKINGIDFALEVSTDYAVHDEQGNHVFGVCEFDPAMPDAAMVSISPVGESFSELLALSTLVREAKFDTSDFATAKERGCEGSALHVSRARADSRNEWFGAFTRGEQRLDVSGHLE